MKEFSGATIKRYAAHVSQTHTVGNPIRDSQSLFEAAQEKFRNIKLFHVTTEDINEIDEKVGVSKRIANSRTIHHTRTFHSFETIPGNNEELRVKVLSTDKFSVPKRIAK